MIDFLPNFKTIDFIQQPWDKEKIKDILRSCYNYAYNNSPDPNTRIGALVYENDVLPYYLECNRLPKAIQNISVDLNDRSKKLFYIEHAERNAIRTARNCGVNLQESILLCTCFACCDCAREIIDSGIKIIIGHEPAYHRNNIKWKDSMIAAHDMFKEAGIECYLLNEKIGGCICLTDNQIWEP